MALVIIGYALAVLTGLKSNAIFLPIKIIFLFYSMLQLVQFYNNDYILNKVYLFSILILFTIPFSVNILGSLGRVFTLLLPMVYVATSIRVLFIFYSWRIIIVSLLKSFRWIYMLPAISFIVLGGDLNQSNIYGEVVGAFVSNHYGWGAFMFIMMHWILLRYKETRFVSFWTLLAVFNVFLLLISGSRSGLLSLAISFLIWFFSSSGSFYIKTVMTTLIVFLMISLLSSDSILNSRLDKTQVQYEDTSENTSDDYYSNSAILADSRATARAIGVLAFVNNPQLFFTGMGIFQFKEGLRNYASWADPIYYHTGVHNSYGEIYFGSGVIVFTYFFWFFILKPIYIYYKYLRVNLLYVIGVFIIPFFESNITAGQFLFYPWFITIFFLLYFKQSLNKAVTIVKGKLK